MVPRVPPGGELRGRHSYAFDNTRLEGQSLLIASGQGGANQEGPAPPCLYLPSFCFLQHIRTTLSGFSVCLVSYRESAIFPSHPPTSGKIEVWETTTLPSLPR